MGELKEWAASTSIAYITARRLYAAGTLPVPTYRVGRLIMVGEPVTGTATDTGQVVVYARVSSADQEPDLDRQVARVTVWATGQKLAVDRVMTEVGSAFNGQRRKCPTRCQSGHRGRPGVKAIQSYRFALDLDPGQKREVLAHAGGGSGRAHLGSRSGQGGLGSAGRRTHSPEHTER